MEDILCDGLISDLAEGPSPELVRKPCVRGERDESVDFEDVSRLDETAQTAREATFHILSGDLLD